MVGKTIAHYQILEKLGEGGMGAVHSADDVRLDHHVSPNDPRPRGLRRDCVDLSTCGRGKPGIVGLLGQLSQFQPRDCPAPGVVGPSQPRSRTILHELSRWRTCESN